MNALLEARQLVKHFRGVKAVDGLDLSLPAGRCFGLLGPNGAGKTTTVELLEGIQEPTSGSIRYRGEPLGARFRQDIGIMFQSTALLDFITGRENLRLFGSFYRRTLPIERLIEECALGGFIDRDSRKLSGGQRQRLLLALALVNDPVLLFLDEPTTGLDPQARHLLWDQLYRLKHAGVTQILTTHYMDEAEQLCDRLVVMDGGLIAAEGSPRELIAEHSTREVVEARFGVVTPDEMDGLAARLGGIADRTEVLPDRILFYTDDAEHTLGQIHGREVRTDTVLVRRSTLEDVFLQLTGRTLVD